MNQLTVSYLDQKIGALGLTPTGVGFEYDPAFITTGRELSPLNLPLRPGVRIRDGGRLPGLFEDSLPDAWGLRVMEEWFRQREVPPGTITPLTKLAYVGSRGMGALTYAPATDIEARDDQAISLARIHEAVQAAGVAGAIDLTELAEVGSSAGGARPKALIALPRDRAGLILAGAGEIPASHEAWLVKFDLSRDGSAGAVEEAYARMQRAAGIDVPETRLLETRHGETVRRHFAVKRFDRDGALRVHHHTLAALCETGGGDLSYETFLRVTRRLARDEAEVWRAFRRAAFNVLANNRDDHGKNHGFLHRDRRWTLGPAYDVTFVSPTLQSERGMSLVGERRIAGRSHLLKLAESEALDRRMAEAMIEEVHAAVSRWREFADEARVPAVRAAEIQNLIG